MSRDLYYIVAFSLLAYLAWLAVLEYGTPAMKAAVTALIIISPIPPVP